MFQLKIELKRVQTFIFEVPRLKAMLGANALIGQTMRHELPALIKGKGKKLEWPKSIVYQGSEDPLDATADPDDPTALYADGILARDGGHFIAVFEEEDKAREFLHTAETTLAERLPGVLYDARIEPFPQPEKQERGEEKREHQKITPPETALLDLPVLQVCQETGTAPASDPNPNEKDRWQARSVTHREEWGDRFYAGKTQDIIGLLHPALYPDKQQNWTEPDDLAQLAAGGYLALIHADGNGIGKRYNERKAKATALDDLGKEAHGEAFFHSMRVAVRRAVVDALKQTFTTPGGRRPYEVLMLGGDDLLLICRADRALDFAQNYATELKKHQLADGKPLDVAIGVAIAQKSYPLHRLQELAESLASSAKRLYRALADQDKTSVVDWQVVTQSWFEGIAEARQQSERVVYTINSQTETLLLSRRPYRVTGEDALKGLLDAARRLDRSGKEKDEEKEKAARSPLRSLRGACERGRLMGEMVFKRLPDDIQSALGCKGAELWQALGSDGQLIYATHALDIIGISEIARLGRKKK